MYKILFLVTFIEIAWCVKFRTVCENEIKEWVLNGKVFERPKPNFDAKDVKFYLYNNDNDGLLLDDGTRRYSSALPRLNVNKNERKKPLRDNEKRDDDLNSGKNDEGKSNEGVSNEDDNKSKVKRSNSGGNDGGSSGSEPGSDGSGSSGSGSGEPGSAGSGGSGEPGSAGSGSGEPGSSGSGGSGGSGSTGNLDKIDKNANTVFVVHGWFEDYQEKWIDNFTHQVVHRHGVNVIVVDYSKYSNDYYKALTKITKDIGSAVAKFLKTLVDKNLVKVETTYFIGFGLGAHISGNVGKEIKKLVPDKKLGRITGLDPAGSLFDAGFSGNLQTNDAAFVDVVQTNSDWLGSDVNFGQANFQVNNGKQQPKCESTVDNNLKNKFRNNDCVDAYNLLRCSHLRSTELWTESVSLNNFIATNGIVMGYEGNTDVQGNFFIRTREIPPYGVGK